MRLKNQLINSTEGFSGEQKFISHLDTNKFKVMNEQVKLAVSLVDFVDRPNRKRSVTMLRYGVDKPVNSFAQVRIRARKKEEEETSSNCLFELQT